MKNSMKVAMVTLSSADKDFSFRYALAAEKDFWLDLMSRGYNIAGMVRTIKNVEVKHPEIHKKLISGELCGGR